MTRSGDEGKPSVSIQATGSDRSRLSVVGEGTLTSIEHQTNIYAEQQDPDIHVDLVDERELVEVVMCPFRGWFDQHVCGGPECG
jgi:hypothetical protein